MTDNARWTALVARDPASDGLFVYAVRTTRIFCRPICKARLARRSNVEFYNTPAEAEAAGYRPCKRCQPLLPTYTPEADKVKKAVDVLDSLPENAPLPGLERLAKEAGLTKHHFHRLFKRETGMTPRQYALSNQKAKSEASPSTAGTPITPFMSDLATPDMNDEQFSNLFGQDIAASDNAKDQLSAEMSIPMVYYDVIETTYGHLLVGFQDKQICKIELGSGQDELLGSLESAFPTPFYAHLPITVAQEDDWNAYLRLCSAM